MKIKKFIVKSSISILATALLICGCFFIDNNKINNDVYADTIIPNTFYVGSQLFESTITNNYGETYIIPEWLYNQRFNTNFGAYTFSEIYQQWRELCTEGLIGNNHFDKLEQLYKISETSLSTDINNTVAGSLGSIVGGTATSNTSKVFKKWIGLITVTTISGLIVKGISDLGSKLYNKLIKTEKNYENNSSNWINFGSNGNFSTPQNYYDNQNNGNYNTGDTYNYPIYNNTTNQLQDIVNNNQHYITNYNYDFNTNQYDFSTDEGYQFILKNSTRYVEIQSLINNVSNTYKQYYKMPNGDNSFNLTDDQIHGLKTDFNVQTYGNTYDNTELKNLYHFNDTFTDESYYNQGKFNITSPSLIYVNDIWQNSLFIDTNSNYRNILHKTIQDKYFDIGFRFMPSLYKHFIIRINYYDTNNVMKSYNIGKEITTSTSYTSKTGSNYVSSSITGTQENKQFVMITANTISAISSICNGMGGSLYGAVQTQYSGNNQNYTQACRIKSEEDIDQTIQTNNNYTQWFANTVENTIYAGIGNNINYGFWNQLNLTNDNNNTLYINLNNTINTINNVNTNKQISIDVLSDHYLLLDELYILQKEIDNNTRYIPQIMLLPKDTNLTYVIPEGIEFNNNLILLKTLNINNWQIGGKRSSSPSNDDVYFNVDENGLITSVQQYKNGNWLPIEGAIYNSIAGKFVSIIGYSVIAGEEQFVDIGTEESQNWLSVKLNELLDTIKNGFSSINDRLDTLINAGKEEKDQIDNYVNDITNADNDIQQQGITDSFTDIQPEIKNLTSLAKSTNQIFDTLNDNGLSIIYIAPLIVLLIRMVI